MKSRPKATCPAWYVIELNHRVEERGSCWESNDGVRKMQNVEAKLSGWCRLHRDTVTEDGYKPSPSLSRSCGSCRQELSFRVEPSAEMSSVDLCQ